ncbi:hypothetical protein OK016_07355 [Vibrio chagasii]|nr:hypothetical protein [Vibrio chagasii]
MMSSKLRSTLMTKNTARLARWHSDQAGNLAAADQYWRCDKQEVRPCRRFANHWRGTIAEEWQMLRFLLLAWGVLLRKNGCQ